MTHCYLAHIQTYKLTDWRLRVTSNLLESDNTNDKIVAYVSVLPQTSAEDEVEKARQVNSWRSITGLHSHRIIQGYAHCIVSTKLQGFTLRILPIIWFTYG